MTQASAHPLSYNDHGTGTPILFVHAFPFDARMWEAQRDAFGQGHRVITPDLRGFGLARDLPQPTALDDHADDLRILLDALELPKVTIVGLSLGGYIALAFARRCPERLGGLVLADTRAAADSAEVKAGRDAGIAKVKGEGVPALVRAMLPKLLAPRASREVQERVLAITESQGAEGAVAALTAMRDRPDSTPVLASINVPSLVIVGAEDAISPPAEARQMADALPQGSLAVIDGAGHLSNLEAPEAFNAALQAFLNEHKL